MRNRKRKTVTLAIGLGILLALALWIAWGNTALELNFRTVASRELPGAFDGYRIAHVSDLHNAQMGRNNGKLLAMLRDARPDMIAITGDLVDSRNLSLEVALDFAEEAVKIAPCYYVTGNHEARITACGRFREGLTERGVTVLSDEETEIELAGERILLLGVDDPSFHTGYLLGDAAAVMESKLAELMEGKSGYTVLLSHRPELFDIYRSSGVNLVLSGHAHGGQIRLPFVGGIVAPNQGLFPRYDGGLYTSGSTSMLVSRGIGNSLFPFRVHNRPEVILIELKTAE